MPRPAAAPPPPLTNSSFRLKRAHQGLIGTGMAQRRIAACPLTPSCTEAQLPHPQLGVACVEELRQKALAEAAARVVRHFAPQGFTRCSPRTAAKQRVRRTTGPWLEIGLHPRVVVEVVLGLQVGEHGSGEMAARHRPWSRAWENSPPMAARARRAATASASWPAAGRRGRGVAGPCAMAGQRLTRVPNRAVCVCRCGGQVLDQVGWVVVLQWLPVTRSRQLLAWILRRNAAASAFRARGQWPSSTSTGSPVWGGCAADALHPIPPRPRQPASKALGQKLPHSTWRPGRRMNKVPGLIRRRIEPGAATFPVWQASGNGKDRPGKQQGVERWRMAGCKPGRRCGWFDRGEPGRAGAGPVCSAGSGWWGGKGSKALAHATLQAITPQPGEEPAASSIRPLASAHGPVPAPPVISSLQGDRFCRGGRTTCAVAERRGGQAISQGLRTGNTLPAEQRLSGEGAIGAGERGLWRGGAVEGCGGR